MKKLLIISILSLVSTISVARQKGRFLTQLKGTIHQELPCIFASAPRSLGCLRVLTQGGGLYYLERVEKPTDLEFEILSTPMMGPVFQISFGEHDHRLLGSNQPIQINGLIEAWGEYGSQGGKILRIDSLEIPTDLTNPSFDH